METPMLAENFMNESRNRTVDLSKKAAPGAGRLAIYWANLTEALRGSERVYTEGSLGRAILLLAIPMVLEMAMESVFAICNIFFVARLGAGAVATVGLTESVLTLVYALAIGLGMATTAIIARRIGEKDRRAANVTVVQTIAMGIIVSLPVSAMGIAFAPDILSLMGASESIVETDSDYTAILLVPRLKSSAN